MLERMLDGGGDANPSWCYSLCLGRAAAPLLGGKGGTRRLSSASMVPGIEGEWRRATGNQPRNVSSERFGCLHAWEKLYITVRSIGIFI
jgi:hypothetical protein